MGKTVAAILVLAGTLFSMDVTFKADSLRGTLGDVFQLSWLVDHKDQDSIYYAFDDPQGSGVEILSQQIKAGKRQTLIQVEAAVYDSVGIYHFPDGVIFHRSGAVLDSLFLRGPDLEIYSILSPADSSFRDIKGLHHIRRPFYWMLLLWILVGGIAVYGVYRLFRYRRNRAQELLNHIKIIPPEEAHTIALRELEHLRREKFLRLSQFKEFHSRLTYILKQYIENRYLIDALEHTTTELMDDLEALSDLKEEHVTTVRAILQLADLIKFAKAESNELESGESLNRAVDLVNETKLVNDMGDDT